MPVAEVIRSEATGLLEAAFDVARRYKSFGSYGSEAAAVRALHRRCSDSGKEQCRAALGRAVSLLGVATEVAARHKELLSETWQTPGADEAASLVCSELRLACPEFSHAACRSALGWIFYWHYL